MHSRKECVTFTIRPKTEIFPRDLVGEHYLSQQGLVSVLDEATDENNQKYNPLLKYYVSKEAEKIYVKEQRPAHLTWIDAKFHLAGRILSFVCQRSEMDEFLFCLQFGEMLDNGTPLPSQALRKRGDLQKPRNLLTYLLRNHPNA